MTSMWGKTSPPLVWAIQSLRDEEDWESLQLERLLEPIGQELTEAYDYVEALEPPEDAEEQWAFESHIEQKCDEVEGLLSVAFVIAQSHITQVASRAIRVLEAAQYAGVSLQQVPQSKEGFLKTCSASVKDTGYTEVQVINAFANFFKHHEEWVGAWEKLENKQALNTAKVIMAVGAKQGSSAPFRTGAEAVGNGTYKNVGAFVGIIREWRKQLASKLEAAAGSAGLL